MIEMTEETLGFHPSSTRLEAERESRKTLMESKLGFGVTFLDHVFRGITKHDIVLLGARTGAGKSELVARIAAENAMQGKRVYVFALEAEPNEIERRIRFSEVARTYYADGHSAPLNFLSWCQGRYDSILTKYEELATEKLKALGNLKTFYRTAGFGLKDFEMLFNVIQGNADLIITDHIHFFDHETDNENKEIEKIAKKARDLSLLYGIPQVIVAHLRKLNRSESVVVPDLEDFHGTSNLSKICTKAVILASGGPLDGDPNQFITFMRIAKFRAFGAAMGYVGQVIFDTKRNQYRDVYKLGRLSDDGKLFIPIEFNKVPDWLKEVRDEVR